MDHAPAGIVTFLAEQPMPGNYASTGSTILVSDSALLFYALLAIPVESVVVSRETLLGNRRGDLWRWPKGRRAWPITSSFKAAAKLAAGPARRSRFLANARIEKPTQQWANTVRMMLLGSSPSPRLPTIETFTFARQFRRGPFPSFGQVPIRLGLPRLLRSINLREASQLHVGEG